MVKPKLYDMTRRDFMACGAYTLATSAVVSNLVSFSTVPASAASLPVPGPADWSRYGYDLHNTRFNPNEKIIGKDNVGRLKVKWKFDHDAHLEATACVIGDTVFLGAPGAYYALDSQTGEQKWKYEMPPEAIADVRRGVQYYKGRIYSADRAGWVRCLDASTGKQVWERDFSAPEPESERPHIFSCACLAFDEKIYLGTVGHKNRVLCLNADTGVTQWEYWVTGKNDIGKGGSMWTSPALDEKERILYMVTGSNKFPGSSDPALFTESILAFDAETGYLRWYYQVHPNDPHDLDIGCHPIIFDAIAPPMKRGSTRECVAAASKDGVYCWDRYTGDLFWEAHLTQSHHYGGPLADSIAYSDNKFYVVSNAATQLIRKPPISVTAALDAFTGRIVWWTYNPEGICVGGVGGANGVFYQGFNNGRMEALDADTGEILWQYTLPTARRGGFAVANGALYTCNGIPGANQQGGAPGWNSRELNQQARRANVYSMYCFTVDGK